MKKKSSGIWAKVAILLSFILAIFAGGYFFLDKLIVPKYFKQYGINGIGDLVNVVASLYSTPNESKMISNGYTQTDLTNGVNKLQKAGYKIEVDGTIKEEITICMSPKIICFVLISVLVLYGITTTILERLDNKIAARNKEIPIFVSEKIKNGNRYRKINSKKSKYKHGSKKKRRR